jgi:hypothetical protein
MTVEPAAAIEAAYQLFGFIFEPTDLIEFRTLGKVCIREWVSQAKAAKVITRIANAGADVQAYYGANPRLRDGGTAADVALARCLFADFDGGTTVEQARQAYTDACIPHPTVTVLTGGGVHMYWRLDEPMTDLALWTRYQKALAARLKSDASVTDAPRILRIPGFVNWKYPHRPVCVVHDCVPENIYSLDEFPDPAHFETAEEPAAPVAPRSLSMLAKRFLDDGYVMAAYGRRTTIFTVACDMAARAWPLAEAKAAIQRRAETLGLSAEDLRDVGRQVENAFKAPRKPSNGPAEAAEPVEESRPLKPVRAPALVQEFPELRRPIIEGVLRSGETLNLVSQPKIGKSWLVTGLAISCATGRPWLGFGMQAGRVLLVDNELHQETTAHRIPKVASAMGVNVESLGNLEVLNLRGNLKDFNSLGAAVFDHIESGCYSLIILDAFYRFIPADVEENSNGGMAGLYNLIDGWARRLDCAFVQVHHTSKGNQSERGVTDVGSGAGSMSRAADTHMILRQHREENCVVLDSAVRSFAPITPKVLRFNWPIFEVDPMADPADLKSAKAAESDGWNAQRFAEEFVTFGGVGADYMVGKAEEFGLSTHRLRILRSAALGKGLIRKTGATKGAVWIRNRLTDGTKEV